MSKGSSARYCQKKAKNIFQKSLVKDITIFLKKKKARNENMIPNDIRIFHKMKKKN